MTWVLVLVIVAIVVVVIVNSPGQVPWGKKMRRVRAGVARRAEWMAPDDVVMQVRADYLAATQWLHDHMLSPWAHQWASAPMHLSGAFLKRYQTILMYHRSKGQPRFIGVLRADHDVTVRQFSPDGERCLVVDSQSQRRMASYDSRTHARVVTQDMGDGALVYQMVYDVKDRRWKIDEFVQELPVGWGKHGKLRRIREFTAMPLTVGRDN
jgi:hypothetical protein